MREIIRCGQVELVSHSYSHVYWGEDDGGGVFVYLDNAGIPAWEKYVDSAVNQNGWSVFLFHTVVEDHIKPPNDYAVLRSQAEALFAYADGYGERLWFPTYDEGTIYYTQWSTATVNAVAAESRIRVDLTHAEKGDMFNMAMTVRVELPDGFDGAYVNGEAIEIHEADGVRYILVDVTPGVPLFIDESRPAEGGDADFEYVPVV